MALLPLFKELLYSFLFCKSATSILNKKIYFRNIYFSVQFFIYRFVEILIMAKKEIEVDPRDLIMKQLELEDRRIAWLSKKTGLSYAHLYFVLVKKERDLTEDNKDKINIILNTNF